MIASILAALMVAAQPPAMPAPEACSAPGSCRYVRSLTLRTARGDVEVKVDEWVPYLRDGTLTLVPGETVVIALDGAGGALKPKLLSAGSAGDLPRDERDASTEQSVLALMDPDRERVGELRGKPGDIAAVRAAPGTVRLTFEQASGRQDTILHVDNGYDRALDYDARMTVSRAGPVHTSICIVRPRLINLEAWPHPIVRIDLTNFRFVDDPGQLQLRHCD